MGFEFFEALKDIVSVIVVANAVIGHKDENMTEEYAEVLKAIMLSEKPKR